MLGEQFDREVHPVLRLSKQGSSTHSSFEQQTAQARIAAMSDMKDQCGMMAPLHTEEKRCEISVISTMGK